MHEIILRTDFPARELETRFPHGLAELQLLSGKLDGYQKYQKSTQVTDQMIWNEGIRGIWNKDETGCFVHTKITLK